MNRSVFFSIFIIGFSAMASQIVLIRELLVAFYGNEMSISIILGNWLLTCALGSYAAGRTGHLFKSKIRPIVACQALLAISIPAAIVTIRLSKSFLGIVSGAAVPILATMLISFAMLLPVCGVLGYIFTLCCRLVEPGSGISSSRIGRVYIIEALGSVVGGLLTSYFLIPHFNSMSLAGFVGALNIFSAFFLFRSLVNASDKGRRLTVMTVVIAVIFASYLFLIKPLDLASRNVQWYPYRIIDSKDSIYGNVVTAERDGQISFFDNGLHLYTIPEKMSAEESVHLPMLMHPDPKDVLLVGGGPGGSISEILKHGVAGVDYVELDPTIVEMAAKHLNAVDSRPLQDPKVAIHHSDGRYFIKNTDKMYDCVIVRLGDPYTAQISRFYTSEFFNEVKSRLKPGGIFSFSLGSSENYIGRELADLLRCLYITLSGVFRDIVVMPGDTAYYVACDNKGVLTYDYEDLISRAGSRGIETEYIRDYYLFSKLSYERIAYIKKVLLDPAGATISSDSRPMAYYYQMLSWAVRLKDRSTALILRLAMNRLSWTALLTMLTIIIIVTVLGPGRRGAAKRSAIAAVMASGFTSISFQIVALFSFQALYGYLYYKLGAILTAFMGGLVCGGMVIVRLMPLIRNDKVALAGAHAITAIYPLAMITLLDLAGAGSGKSLSWVMPNLIFIALPFFAGFAGGVEFPLCVKIYMGGHDSVERGAGYSYGADLIGSWIGAMLTGVFIIPLLGLRGSCVALTQVNLVVMAVIIVSAINLKGRKVL